MYVDGPWPVKNNTRMQYEKIHIGSVRRLKGIIFDRLINNNNTTIINMYV